MPAIEESRTARELVLDRRFGRYFFGNLFSNAGNWCQIMAIWPVFFLGVRPIEAVVAGGMALWLLGNVNSDDRSREPAPTA